MLIHAATDNEIHPPTFGGAQRSFGLYRGLARRHRVEALCLVPNRDPAPRDETVAGVRIMRRKAWYTSAAWRLELARVAPLFCAAAGHAANAGRLAREFSGPADALLADLSLAGLMRADPAPLRVYTAHNVEYDHFREAGPALLAPAFWAERRRAMEAEAVARAHLTVVCGEEDAARMCELYGVDAAALLVAPNGYDETSVRPPAPEERARARAALGVADDEYVALFVASDVPHNRAAVEALVGWVMPPLADAKVRLVVAGAVIRALTRRAAPWLIARPETPDLLPVLHAADVGVNAVTGGGGSNVKVPTYLGAGLAVITTPHGLRGYASLAPWVTSVTLEHMTEALRARPQGWLARGLAMPDAVRDHAWGRLGERLGEMLEAKRRGAPAVAAAGRAGA